MISIVSIMLKMPQLLRIVEREVVKCNGKHRLKVKTKTKTFVFKRLITN